MRGGSVSRLQECMRTGTCFSFAHLQAARLPGCRLSFPASDALLLKRLGLIGGCRSNQARVRVVRGCRGFWVLHGLGSDGELNKKASLRDAFLGSSCALHHKDGNALFSHKRSLPAIGKVCAKINLHREFFGGENLARSA